MKFLFTLLTVFVFTSSSLVQIPITHNDCTGQGLYCSCNTMCDDDLEANCSFDLTCSCLCRGEGVKTQHSKVSMTDMQRENSEEAEEYFRTQGLSDIANGLKELRGLIEANDYDVYHSEAAYLRGLYTTLSQSEKDAYEDWVSTSIRN